jgi:hydroxyethylthiazole kinase-like uncharacterized protein yjeF
LLRRVPGMKSVPSITPKQMGKIDGIMEKRMHISVLQMMENDGKVISNLACGMYGLPGDVTVIAGKGNNGGGGLAAARHLRNRGCDVSIVLASNELKPAPMEQLRAAKAFGIPVVSDVPDKPGLIIDSLLGYNAQGPPRDRVAELIAQAVKTGSQVLCNDVPTGLDLSTGKWFSPSFKGADVITLGLPKAGMIGNPGIRRLFLADIGIPAKAYSMIGMDVPGLFAESDCIEITAQHSLGIG